MAVLLKKAPNILENGIVLIQAKRFRGKINIQRPREPHFERAKIMKLTEPFYPSPKYKKPLVELCTNLKPKIVEGTEENPFQKILAKECLNWFNHSRVIALFHLNPMCEEDRFSAYLAFKKQNMHLKMYGMKTLKMALDGTNYELFTKHYVSHNIMLFNPEPTIKPMLKILKKYPQMVLLSAIYEGKYLSKDEFLAVSNIPDLQTAQARLVHVLQSVGGGLVKNLTQCQSTLVHQLQERSKQLEEKSKPVEEKSKPVEEKSQPLEEKS